MSAITVYFAVAMVSAAAAFLLSELFRQPGTASPDHPGVVAMLAGLLWPVLLIGLAQGVLVAVAHARLRGPATSAPLRADVKV